MSFIKSNRKPALILSFLLILTFCFNSPKTVSAEPEIDTSETVNLRWIVPGNGDQEDIDLVESAINFYLEDKINATLELKTFMWGNDFEQKLAIIMAAGEPYDINFTANWAADYRQNALDSAYLDITDMLDTYAPQTKALLGKNILKGAEVNGRIYALPVYRSSITAEYGILLNNELVKKYKVDISKIKKLQDLEPILKTIKSKDRKTIGFYPFDKYGSDGIVNTLNYDKLNTEAPGAVLRDGKSTKVINEFETNDAKNLFSLMNKWYKAGYIPKLDTSDTIYFDRNRENIFALYSEFNAKTHDDMLNSNIVDMVPVSFSKPVLTTDTVCGAMHAISSNSENPERALMLLELVNTDEELSNLLNYGIEELHYYKTGDKTIEQYQDGEDSYNPGLTWLFGNETITYSLPGYNPEVWNKLNADVNNAVASPLLGFSFNSDPVENQINNLGEIQSKYLGNLTAGKVDPNSTLSKMNSEMKKAGLQKVLTEMQKQVDKFKAKNNS